MPAAAAVPDRVYAVVLGVIEGLTEFIPVSSTGMMPPAKKAMELEDPFWNTFAVMNQPGAILAVAVLYFGKLREQVAALPRDPAARRFALGLLLAFLPSAVLGLLLVDFIKGVLFDSPLVQCISLVVGGGALLAIDRVAPPPGDREATRLPLAESLAIGFFQVLAMMPGVSRSGAAIVGSMLVRVDKRAAAASAARGSSCRVSRSPTPLSRSPVRASLRILAVLLLALLPACAPAGAGGHGRSSDLITAEEIAANPSPSAYELVRKLRPTWLRGRGVTSLRDPAAAGAIVVYLDESRFGGVESLRQVSASGIRSIRYLTPSSPGVRIRGNENAYVIQVRLEG